MYSCLGRIIYCDHDGVIDDRHPAIKIMSVYCAMCVCMCMLHIIIFCVCMMILHMYNDIVLCVT